MQDSALPALDVARLRAEFPYFAAADTARQTGQDFAVYLDSAATSQRPEPVLNAEYRFAALGNAAVHRGTNIAVGEATGAFETARQEVAEFLGCGSEYTVVWQAGATDALNTLAFAISEANLGLGVPGSDRFRLQPGDEILVPLSEHHANLVPWQRLAARTGARLVNLPLTAAGTWTLEALAECVTERTRVFAFAHVSNVTGWIAPVTAAVHLVKQLSKDRCYTVLDACQSVPHLPFNITELGVDFAVFSGHKMLGPNGIGALVGKTELLNTLPPARTGGSAITLVTGNTAEFLPAPQRFEPGTQPVSQAIGLAAAARYLTELDMRRVAATAHERVGQLLDGIAALPGVTLIGPADPAHRAALAAVSVAGIHPHDVGQVLDTNGVLVRVGHHCAQPLHRELGLNASVRASVHMTTLPFEVEAFLAGLKDAQRYFGVN